MNDKTFALAARLIPGTYVRQAKEAKIAREAKVAQLIEQRKLPVDGWPEEDIESFLHDLSAMDSNNFPGNCGVGEREARIVSGLVYRRNFGTGHGIGRSGDLCEVQPKAAGSSLINKLTNSMVLDLIRQCGIRSCQDCFVVPMATGMALTLCLLHFRSNRPSAKYVIFSRIDQKSCFKSIISAGYIPVTIELKSFDDELGTDVDKIDKKISELGPSHIAAVLTCTSCFAPRGADDIPRVARICHSQGVPHLVNNAYGVQSSKCCHLLEEGSKTGRIDAFVQSTDKNFMVPVGGAVVAGFDKELVQKVSKLYPGRASSSPSIDVFITLLSLGLNGYKKLLSERKDNYILLKSEMVKIAQKHGEKVLETKNNPISIALTLSKVRGDSRAISEVGSMLFVRGVSGTRVVTGRDVKQIEGYKFNGWGSHSDHTKVPYLTAAAAIGMTKEDIELFIRRLDKVLGKVLKSKDSHEEKHKSKEESQKHNHRRHSFHEEPSENSMRESRSFHHEEKQHSKKEESHKHEHRRHSLQDEPSENSVRKSKSSHHEERQHTSKEGSHKHQHRHRSLPEEPSEASSAMAMPKPSRQEVKQHSSKERSHKHQHQRQEEPSEVSASMMIPSTEKSHTRQHRHPDDPSQRSTVVVMPKEVK